MSRPTNELAFVRDRLNLRKVRRGVGQILHFYSLSGFTIFRPLVTPDIAEETFHPSAPPFTWGATHYFFCAHDRSQALCSGAAQRGNQL